MASDNRDGGSTQRETIVERVIAVIDCLVRQDDAGVGVRELAAELGVSRSVTHRILQTLTDLGVAKSLPGGRYGTGVVMISWGALVGHAHALLAIGREIVDDLVKSANEAAFLTTYGAGDDWTTVVYVKESPRLLRYEVPVGTRVSLHVGGSGKAILARLGDDVLDRLALPVYTDRTIADRESLRRECALIRSNGYAVNLGEVEPDAAGVGAAFCVGGEVAGAVNINIPTARYDERDLPRLSALVTAAAKRIEQLLSATSRPILHASDEADPVSPPR